MFRIRKSRSLAFAILFALAGCMTPAADEDVSPETAEAPLEPGNLAAPTETSAALEIFDQRFEFMLYGQVLELGADTEWDDFALWSPDIVFHEGLYYMFYTGFGNSQYNNSAIGYATSEDGLIWGKHSGNPIISDISGYPKLQAPAAMLDGERWIMYFDAGENGQPLNRFILRATAPAPEGPWDVDEIPAIEGRARTWDQRSQPVTVLLVDGVYYLFYNGVGSPDGPQMGLATSPDNQTWSLYNDPGTAERLYEFSDPVLKSGPAGAWDAGGVASYEVMYHDGLWEMFYVGFPINPFSPGASPAAEPLSIGYASSQDGIHWKKYAGNPVFSSGERCWPLIDSLIADGIYRIYFDLDCGPGGLGLIEGRIAPE